MQLRVRFVWNKATHRDWRARKLIGLTLVSEEETTKGHFKTVWLDAKMLLKLAAVVAAVGWFAASGGLWVWLDRDPFNRVGFADLACPWHWEKISDRRGQGYLAAGLNDLREHKINEALFAIRQGLARHPDAPAARLAVARLYARSGFYTGVREIMLPQLALTTPPHEFVRFLLDAAAQNDDHVTMLAACDRALVADGLTAANHGWLLERRAAALIALGKQSEALAVLDVADRNRTLEWRKLRVTALCGAGRAAEAVAEIRAWPVGGVPGEFRLQLLAAACRHSGQLDGMSEALRELVRLHPGEPEPRIEAIGHYVRAGWDDAAWNELQECLRRFDADAAVVARIEQACVAAGAPQLVAACVEITRELGRPLVMPLCDLALTQLRAGDAAAAGRSFERLLAEDRKARERTAGITKELLMPALGSPSFGSGLRGTLTSANGAVAGMPRAMRDFIQTLLDAVAQPTSDRAEAHCGALLRGNFRLGAFAGSAEVFAKFGHWPAVAAVARAGLTRFPGSTQLTQWSETAAGKIAALPSPAPTALAVVVRNAPTSAAQIEVAAAVPLRPNYEVMPQTEFFAKLDDAMQRKAWAVASDLLRGIRTAAPPWLSRVEADLAWREVRIAFEQDDRPQLLYLIGQRIRTRKVEVSRALEFARWYREKGEFDIARLIVGKVLQEVPGYVAGQDFLTDMMKSAQTQARPPAVPTPH